MLRLPDVRTTGHRKPESIEKSSDVANHSNHHVERGRYQAGGTRGGGARLRLHRRGGARTSPELEKQRDGFWAGDRHVTDTVHTRYDDGDLLSVPRKDGIRISLEFTISPAHDREDGIERPVAMTQCFRELRSDAIRLPGSFGGNA